MKKRWICLALAIVLFSGQWMPGTSKVVAEEAEEVVETHTMGSGIKQADITNELFLFNEESVGSDPTNPTDPTTPTDPTGPIDSTNPTDPITPTDPTAPTEPTNPTDPTTPTEPTGPTDPTTPTEPATPTDPDPTTPDTSAWNVTKKVKMVDLSYWDEKVDFKKLKGAGIKYVMLRIGHGMEKDTVFTRFYKDAKANGFKIGVYYYSTATTVKRAKEEADYTLKLLAKNKIEPADLDLPVCFDFEDPKALKTSKTNCTNMTVEFLEKIKAAGFVPMVYSSGSFYNEKLDYSRIKDYKIWVANWKVKGPIMKYPYVAWQYTASATVAGIPVKCDVSYLYPKYVAVKKLTSKYTKATVKKGRTKTLPITMSPSSCTNKRLIWKSGNKRIVKIVDEQKGIIKGIRRGKTIVKVKTPNGKSYTYTVKVK